MKKLNTDKLVRDKIIEIYKSAGYASFYVKQRWWMCPFLLVESYLPDAGTIIDIGSGYGIMSIVLAIRSTKRKVVGIDKSNYRIKKANQISEQIPNVKFINDDVFNVEINNVDGVVMNDFLHHIPYDKQFDILKLAYDKLSYNGILVIKDVDTVPIRKHWQTVIFETLFYPKDKYAVRPSQEYINMLEEIGFKPVVFPWPGRIFPTVIYVCKK